MSGDSSEHESEPGTEAQPDKPKGLWKPEVRTASMPTGVVHIKHRPTAALWFSCAKTQRWRIAAWRFRCPSRFLGQSIAAGAEWCWVRMHVEVEGAALTARLCVLTQEDKLLRELVEAHGTKSWSTIAKGIPKRNGKSCRLRWAARLEGLHCLPCT